MKRLALFLGCCLASLALSAQSDHPTQYVRSMMGTSLDGRIIPLAVAPFGMVQLAPDTFYSGCGYHYTHDHILSFSHSHANGNGGGDMQDICFMPVSGEKWGKLEEYPDDIQSRYSHEREHAEPGYFSVDLLDYDIKAELTATKRTGVHRYTYSGKGPQFVTIDMKRGNASRATTIPEEFHDTVMVCQIEVVDAYTVRGYRVTEGWSPEEHAYFCARFSKPMTLSRMYNYRKYTGARSVISRDVRLIAGFENDGKPLEIKVGYSPVSMEGAEKNMMAETEGKDFDAVRAETKAAWDKELSAIQVFDEDSEQKEVFYSSLYFALMYPQLYSDVDGWYRSSDFKAHHGSFNYYAGVLGLWDTFRTQDPLIGILHPEVMNDLMKTFTQHFYNCGQLPIWTINGEENMCMTGYHAMPVIADAYSKGIRDYDADSLLNAMVMSADRDTFGFFNRKFRGAKFYTKYHYVPCDLETHATSKTLEYAYDDWCIAQTARMMGNRKVYRRFMERAQWYRNVYDPEVGFTRGRDSNGIWRPGFDPLYDGGYGEISDYCEGNSYQYSFFVPQDVYGLMELMGGKEKFVEKLDAMFTTTGPGQKEREFGRIGQYAHTNEPVHHVLYLYNYAGEPWKCQKMVSDVLYTQYNTSPEGMCGNDDTGQMSAWYVMSAMGFYPVTHGQDYYVLGSPMFKKVSMKHSKGTLTILAPEASRENCYIQSVKVNGKNYRKNWIKGKDLLGEDVTIEFTMGDKPNEEWGSKARLCPPGGDGRHIRRFK